MKKVVLLLINLIIATGVFAQIISKEKSDELFKHMNFSFGFTFSNDGQIVGTGSLNITLIDRFDDIYNFNYNSDDNEDFSYGYDFYLSIPVFLTNYFSTGIFTQAMLQHTGSTYFDGGIYIEGKINQFSLRTGIGLSGIYISKSLGNLVAAWSGDPGYYTGNKFIKPGSSLNASTTEYLGFTANISFKFYPFYNFSNWLKYFHIKAGYYYFQGKEISNYRLVLDGVDVETNKQLPIFTINPINTFFIGFGFGL